MARAALPMLPGSSRKAERPWRLSRASAASVRSMMRLRTRKRTPEQSIESMLPSFLEDGHHEERFQSWEEPVDKLMERAENRQLVRQQIDALPEGYRTVLVLRDIEGLDTEETAKVLGLSVNATKIRLHRARQALRTLLAPHFRSAAS